jgi:putative ABC transport system permease protein
MLILKLAIRGLARSAKTTVLLLGLVAAGVLLFALGDSVLEAATGGMRKEFQEGYTGDIAIRTQFDRKFGIFGFSVPNIGEFEDIPTLAQVQEIRKYLGDMPTVANVAALVSGAALLQSPGGYELKVPVFGVKADEYFQFFPAIRFITGAPPQGNEAWIILPTSRVKQIEKAEGRKISVGESFQFIMTSGGAFTIRAVRLAGIVETPLHGDSAIIPVYTDAVTLRALLSLAGASGQPQANGNEAHNATNTVDLDQFFSSEDTTSELHTVIVPNGTDVARGIKLVSKYLSEPDMAVARPDVELGAWHFVLIRLSPGASGFAVRRNVNAALKRAGITAEAVDWLSVAGLNAGVLGLLTSIFKLGMVVLASVIALVLTNGLAFSVIEQTREIGTMQAMGAQKSFVRNIYLLESCLLVGFGAAAGLAAAALVLRSIHTVGLPLTNPYLVQVFGSSRLTPSFPLSALFECLLGSIVVAIVSAVYPLGLVTKTSIAKTMAAE